MRLLAAFSFLALASVAPSHAGGWDVGSEKLSSETATAVLWDFARCSVTGNRQAVRAMLDDDVASNDGDTTVKRLQKIVQGQRGCLAPASSLRGQASLFYDMLAGAMFLDKSKVGELPDYSKSPQVFPLDKLDKFEKPHDRQFYLMRIFGECVFQSSPSAAQALIGSRPFSKEEAAIWPKLQQAMGKCLPATEGTKLQLSKILIRRNISLAAYRVDEAYERAKQKQTARMTKQERRYA